MHRLLAALACSALACLDASAAPALSGVVAISVGDSHTCALMATGGVKCWGRADLLGDGTDGVAGRPAPGDVTGYASGVAAISAGSKHTCLVTTGGALKCWGFNDYGRVGDRTATDP